MKKVLTLMGALSVAGSALAHDYLWNMSDLSGKKWSEGFTEGALNYLGDSNSSYDVVKKGVVSTVKGSEANNRFKFVVEAGDVVFVHAITVSNNTGKVYLKQNGLETNADIDNSGSTVLTVSTNKTAGGDVFVYADPNVVITKIVVVSAKYNEVVAKIKEARAAVDLAKSESDRLVSYVTDYPDFYTAITRQISLKVSNEIIAIEKKLADDAAENKVSKLDSGDGTGDDLIAALDALVNPTTGVLKRIEEAAAAAKSDYETTFLTGTDYTNAHAAITLAYKDQPTVAEATGYTIKKVTNTKNGVATAWADKADGLRAYMDAKAKAYFDQAKVDAEAELANFPWTDDEGNDHTYPVATYNTKMQTTVTYIHNIIDRFVYEKAHKSEYSTLKTNVENTASHITAAGLTKPAGFDALKTNVTDLYDLLNKADNKETYNKAQIDDPGTVFKQVLSGYNSTYTAVQATLTAEAKGKQDTECEATQNALNEYSGKITELYTGQPETQKEYEEKFAKLQVSLNDIKAYSTYAQRVAGYADCMAAIQSINNKISELWSGAQTMQNQEIIKQNNDNKTKLDAEITAALTAYNEGVNKINGYKGIKGIDANAVATIDAELVKVFDYAADIEKAKNDAAQAVLTANTSSPAVSFDYNKYSTDVTAAVNNITNSIVAARAAANDAAYNYLTIYDREPVEGTLPYALDQINDAKGLFNGTTGWSNQYNRYGNLSASALKAGALDRIDSLQTARFKTVNGNRVQIEGTGIYSTTLAFVNTHNADYVENRVTKQRDIADYISKVAEDLQPLGGELTNILDRVQAFDQLDAQITQLKIRWSVAKANVEQRTDVDLVEMLNGINAEIVTLKADLDKAAFDAKDQKKQIEQRVAAINDELWKVENYDVFLANEAALETINNAIKDVQDEVTAAKAEVAKLTTEEVVNDYTAQLDAISLTAVESARDSYYKNHTLNENVNALQSSLTAISQNIASIVADAQAADKAAQEVPGDVNGDKVLDAADAEIIETFAVLGEQEEETDELKALRAKSDLNGDGKVNTSDLNEFFKLYKGGNEE